MIYFDEFSVSTRHFTYRGRNQKRNKRFLLDNDDSFSISINIAFLINSYMDKWLIPRLLTPNELIDFILRFARQGN